MAYPNRFLEFYYAANPEELGDEPGTQQASRPSDGDEGVEDAGGTAPQKKQPKVENPIFQHLIFERSRCKPTGPNRGEYTHTFRSPAHNSDMARSLGCTGRRIATPTSSLIANTSVVAHSCLTIALYDRCLIAAGALSSVVRCAIKVQGDQECGCQVSTYSTSEFAAQTTTNAHKHIRARADKGCRVSVLPVDVAILRQL